MSAQNAPTVWTVKYVDQDGFECTLSLAGEDIKALVLQSRQVLHSLKAAGCKPQPTSCTAPATNGNGNGHTPAASIDPAWCTVHNVKMTKHESGGQVWYSHKVDGAWCRGKAPKESKAGG